jgi:histidinol dehydrogenase
VPLPVKLDQGNDNNENGNENAGDKLKKPKKETRTVDEMTLIVEKVIEMAKSGNEWAIEHIAQRFDGKVREQVEVTTNTNLKVRYESYEEVRAALLEEGINIDRLPMLEDLRSVEEQEQEQEPS